MSLAVAINLCKVQITRLFIHAFARQRIPIFEARERWKNMLLPSFYELCASNTLSATSSPWLCTETDPAKPKEYTQDASFLQVMSELLIPGGWLSHAGGGKSQPRKLLILLHVKKWKAWYITTLKVNSETRHPVCSTGPLLTYVTTCDRRKIISEV